MIENAQKGRLEEIVEAEQSIIVLSAELAKYKAITAQWEVSFDTHIKVENQISLVVTAKTQKAAVTQIIGFDTIVYYADDAESFARNLARKMVSDLLSAEVDALLTPKLTRAFQNAIQIKAAQ